MKQLSSIDITKCKKKLRLPVPRVQDICTHEDGRPKTSYSLEICVFTQSDKRLMEEGETVTRDGTRVADKRSGLDRSSGPKIKIHPKFRTHAITARDTCYPFVPSQSWDIDYQCQSAEIKFKNMAILVHV